MMIYLTMIGSQTTLMRPEPNRYTRTLKQIVGGLEKMKPKIKMVWRAMMSKKRNLAITPVERVLRRQKYFELLRNRGRMQPPSPEAALMRQNLGKMYHVVGVLRGGPISGLPIEVNSGIAIISFDHLGLHLSENEHL
jgi:hypothetical protein